MNVRRLKAYGLRQEKEAERQVDYAEHDYTTISKDMKQEFHKPSPIAFSKAPTGRGNTKGDILMQRLAMEFGYDPIKEMVKLAKSDKTTSDLKFKIASELTGYYLPKVKAIDTNPNQGEVISINVITPA